MTNTDILSESYLRELYLDKKSNIISESFFNKKVSEYYRDSNVFNQLIQKTKEAKGHSLV